MGIIGISRKTIVLSTILKNIRVINWPARSPDINIVEDIWKKISDLVYNGPQFRNRNDLSNAVTNAVKELNLNNRQFTTNLYSGIRSRLCTVLNKMGQLCNK